MTQIPRKARSEARQDRPAASGSEAMVAGAATGAMLLGVLDPGRLVAAEDAKGQGSRVQETDFAASEGASDQRSSVHDGEVPPREDAHSGQTDTSDTSDAPQAPDAPKSVQDEAVRQNGNMGEQQAASDPSVPVDPDEISIGQTAVAGSTGDPSTAPRSVQEASSQPTSDFSAMASEISQSVTAATQTALSTAMLDLGTAVSQSTSGLFDEISSLSELGDDIVGTLSDPLEEPIPSDVANLYNPVSDLTAVTEATETLSEITGSIQTDLSEAIGGLTTTIEVSSSLILSQDIASMTDIGDATEAITTALGVPDNNLGTASEALASITSDVDAALGQDSSGATDGFASALSNDPVATPAVPETILGAVASAGEASLLSKIFYDDGQSEAGALAKAAAFPDIADMTPEGTSLLESVPFVGTSYADHAGAEYDGSGPQLGGVFG
ncbi:hypothetical protein ACRARG_12065 [Pseudooceanicola sp. C21-150M6]|uniref:hypothetical protein n=1 Tax=Pseudooceanicola sp. C21-150M6 TaxID=3434355 RepID=UPI003D7FE891